jgi:plasmid stability protein
MTITIDLPPDVEAWLRAEAARRGMSVEDYAISIIREALGMDNAPSDKLEIGE